MKTRGGRGDGKKQAHDLQSRSTALSPCGVEKSPDTPVIFNFLELGYQVTGACLPPQVKALNSFTLETYFCVPHILMGELWVLFCSEGGHTPTAPLQLLSLLSAQWQNLQAGDSPILGY